MVTILFILSGLLLFFLDDLSGTNLRGNIAAIFSSFGFSGLILFLRKQKQGRPIDSVLMGNLLTFCICIPSIFQDVTFEASDWIKIVFLGIIQLGLAYILFFNYSMQLAVGTNFQNRCRKTTTAYTVLVKAMILEHHLREYEHKRQYPYNCKLKGSSLHVNGPIY